MEEIARPKDGSKRHEFSKSIKQAALRRSGSVCEASGVVYGLEAETRCRRLLSEGVEFDHYPEPAHVEGSNRLDNCLAVCRICHKHKTRTFDIPAEAKIKRLKREAGPKELRRKRAAIPKQAKPQWPQGQKLQSRGFNKPIK